MAEELKDKKLYSYKQALSQPVWIQKLNDRFSLPSPVKFSHLVYFIIVVYLLYTLSGKLLFFLPWGMRFVASLFFGWGIAERLANMIVDGKALVFYLKDYIRFWWQYGRHGESIYINKGRVYQKPKTIRKGSEQ